jgi:hypothetical protein
LTSLIICLVYAARRSTAELQLDNVLADNNGIFLANKKFLDSAGFRRIDGDVDL